MTRRGAIGMLATQATAMQPDHEVSFVSGVVFGGKPMLKLFPNGDLTVYEGGRQVTVTLAEIMDALLPVKPGYCPTCGHAAAQSDGAWMAIGKREVVECPRCHNIFGRQA